MDRLKGRDILIGKEPDTGKLLICIHINGKMCTATIGQPGLVPNSVSRCKPAEQVAHCKLEVDAKGAMRIMNLKFQNVTYVDGVAVMSKHIERDSMVALGRDHFTIDVSSILDAAKRIVDTVLPPPPVEYSIAHLENVWDEYAQVLEDIQRRQIEKGKRRMLPIMLGSMSSLSAPLFATLVSASTLIITVPIAAISFWLYLKNYREKDTTIDERKEAFDKLIDKYVCPNPKCGRFVGSQPYKVLKQYKKCPYCGAHWKC